MTGGGTQTCQTPSNLATVDVDGNLAVYSLSTGAGAGTGVITLSPGTLATLPGSPTHGMIAAVTDSTTNTWGATITGGGANKVLAFYNGTNWTVMGK
jgi:hypothetical protein